MFLLAAKLALAISTSDDFQAARLSEREMAVWSQIRPAMVTLYGNGKPVGVAALVDDSGYFVAHSSSVVGVQPQGITQSGKQLPFTIVSQDRATSLVLLKTNLWPAGSAHPFRSPAAGEAEVGDLIAALPSGPIRMAYGNKHKLGVLEPTRRLLPYTEIRFEATTQSVGGALVFSSNGDFVGSVNATLVGPEDQNQRNQNNFGGGQGGYGGVVTQSAVGNQKQYNNSGPSEMTVAYTVSVDFIRHVLDGFLSPGHSVEYAMLGVFCTDAIGGGAQIQSVTPGSPADKAGLRGGDILLNIASFPIQDQVAFAAVMLQQKVGKRIALVVQRGQAKLLVDIVPGKAAN